MVAAALSIGENLVFMLYKITKKFCLGQLTHVGVLSSWGGFGGGSAAGVGWFRLVVMGPRCLDGGCSGIPHSMGLISEELKFTVVVTVSDLFL